MKPRPRELQAQLEELKERMNSRMDEMQAAHAAETRELKAMLRQLLVKRWQYGIQSSVVIVQQPGPDHYRPEQQ